MISDRERSLCDIGPWILAVGEELLNRNPAHDELSQMLRIYSKARGPCWRKAKKLWLVALQAFMEQKPTPDEICWQVVYPLQEASWKYDRNRRDEDEIDEGKIIVESALSVLAGKSVRDETLRFFTKIIIRRDLQEKFFERLLEQTTDKDHLGYIAETSWAPEKVAEKAMRKLLGREPTADEALSLGRHGRLPRSYD